MEQRLIDIFDLIEIANTDVCVIVTDKMLELPGPHILYVNNKWQDVTGYSSDEVIGKTPRILQGPKSCRETLDKLKVILKADETFEGTTINYAKDGSEIQMTWLAIQSIDGFFVALQKVDNDDQEKILLQLKNIGLELIVKLKEPR
jgi:PAS domain S-box-containing protein